MNEEILKVVDVTKTFEGVHALVGVSFGVTRGHIKGTYRAEWRGENNSA